MPVDLVLPPPSPTPRWPGLLASVGGEAAVTDNGRRWEGGFGFQGEWCDLNEGAPLPGDPCDFGGFSTGSSNPEPGLDVEDRAFYYWERTVCSTFGSRRDELSQRAEDRLRQTTSYKLERELWTGTAHRADSLSGQWLTDNTATTQLNSGTAIPLAYALAELQEAWGSCSQGRRAMIHCTPRTATLWLSAGVVFRDGGFLLDGYGNVVVPGTGYDGSSPSHSVDATGDTAWAYATGFVQVRLSPIEVVERSGARTDTTNNVDAALAFRAGAVSFDPCCTLGVNVDLCSPCCTAS